MAVKGTGRLNLLDHAAAVDDGGKILAIVELLAQVNQIMQDMIVIPSNSETGHKTGIRTGLPSVAWRQINQGVVPSKSSRKAITFTPGMIEQIGEVDEELVSIADDGAAFRLSENQPQMEAIGQELASTVFYGDQKVNPDRFTGLASYYSTLDPLIDSSANIIDAGGLGSDNTSLWLIVWAENATHGFFPKNTQAGIMHEDKGKERIEDAAGSGKFYYAWVDQYKAKLGMAVRDWRQNVRIANIDVSDLGTADDPADTSANLFKHAIQATNKVWNLEGGRAAWYCNRTLKTALDIKAYNKTNAHLSVRDVESGTPQTFLMGIPVRRVDAILNTEARVTV